MESFYIDSSKSEYITLQNRYRYNAAVADGGNKEDGDNDDDDDDDDEDDDDDDDDGNEDDGDVTLFFSRLTPWCSGDMCLS